MTPAREAGNQPVYPVVENLIAEVRLRVLVVRKLANLMRVVELRDQLGLFLDLVQRAARLALRRLVDRLKLALARRLHGSIDIERAAGFRCDPGELRLDEPVA